MVVDNDPPHFLPKNEMAAKKQNGRQKIKWSPKTKLSITQSIFKLEAPYFTWGHFHTTWENKQKLDFFRKAIPLF